MENCQHLFVKSRLATGEVLYECLKCRDSNFDVDRYSFGEYANIDTHFQLSNYPNSKIINLGTCMDISEYYNYFLELYNNNISNEEDGIIYLDKLKKRRGRK